MAVRRAKPIITVLVTVAALSLAACSSTSEPPPATESDVDDTQATADPTPDEPLTIGLVLPQGDKYFQGIEAGMQEAAKADGTEVIVVNSQVDASIEATNVQNLIQRGVDAIVMQPAVSAAGSLATMQSVKDAGIVLICFGNCTDEAASPDVVEGVVQSDNTALGTGTGEAAAAYITEHLGGKAVIGILNCDSYEVCKLRKTGFKEALEAGGVTAEYVADQEGFLADKATPIATNMLLANPEINVLWSANEGGTIGLVTAAVASDRDLVVFGTDITDQLAEFILDEGGPLQTVTGQDPESTAADAYAAALNAINGTPNDPFEILVPGTTYSATDPANAQAYLGN